MSNKTISINPSLFSLTKTKKNKEKKEKSSVVPLISPNVLKNKLLKRIKEHKLNETANLENNKTKISNNISVKPNDIDNNSNIQTFNDEFNDSISYLQTLSKQKKVNEEKAKYDREKEKRREELERKTLKHYHSMNNSIVPAVNIDLPEELQSPLITVNTSNLNYNDNVPYGVLKNGTKPTYRDWNKTQRNLTVTNPNDSLIIQNNTINKSVSQRESRLNDLRDKLKLKEKEKENDMLKKEQLNIVDKPLNEFAIQSGGLQTMTPIIDSTKDILHTLSNTYSKSNITEINDLSTQILQPSETKRLIKKTIKRKYTLGKSKLKKSVSVLLKDRGTRKKVIAAQRDLKRKSMSDIKSYLRDHNLIRIGSNAPNDVLRKLYETSMLAGEITNKNPETLLHNLSKDEKEL